METVLIAFLGSLTGALTAATAYLWRAQRGNSHPKNSHSNNPRSNRDMQQVLEVLQAIKFEVIETRKSRDIFIARFEHDLDHLLEICLETQTILKSERR